MEATDKKRLGDLSILSCLIETRGEAASWFCQQRVLGLAEPQRILILPMLGLEHVHLVISFAASTTLFAEHVVIHRIITSSTAPRHCTTQDVQRERERETHYQPKHTIVKHSMSVLGF
jgi:hypothetical protein